MRTMYWLFMPRLFLLKQDSTNILTALSTLNAVEGRFQYLKSDTGIIGIVDYAHTPDALKNVLETIKGIRTGNEQVITLLVVVATVMQLSGP